MQCALILIRWSRLDYRCGEELWIIQIGDDPNILTAISLQTCLSPCLEIERYTGLNVLAHDPNRTLTLYSTSNIISCLLLNAPDFPVPQLPIKPEALQDVLIGWMVPVHSLGTDECDATEDLFNWRGSQENS